MKLVDDWQSAWRWWSVKLNLIGNAMLVALLAFPAIAQEIWASLPVELKAMLPVRVAYFVPVAIFVAATVARLIQQGGRKDER